jgi:hypothetical protein
MYVYMMYMYIIVRLSCLLLKHTPNYPPSLDISSVILTSILGPLKTKKKYFRLETHAKKDTIPKINIDPAI